MRNACVTIARKELLEGMRDMRSVVSALMYAAMGPAVGLMVSIAVRGSSKPSAVQVVMAGLTSVFTLVAAFVGGTNVAMDTIAGERERRTLLPLLINPITRLDVVLGKWLAIGVFCMAGLVVNFLGFALIPNASRGALLGFAAIFIAGWIPLVLFAAALELVISTTCRAAKEAHTYLSWLVFLPMMVGMLLVFVKAPAWVSVLPLSGQQIVFSSWLQGNAIGASSVALQALCTIAATAALLLLAARQLEKEDAVLGN